MTRRFVLWLAERYHLRTNPHAWRTIIDNDGEYVIEI
jgi:hypothetical protein